MTCAPVLARSTKKGTLMVYEGRNVVTTNPSSRNHGKPAQLNVTRRGNKVELAQQMAGGNTYAILLDSTNAGLLATELARLAPTAALADVLGAVAARIAEGSSALPPGKPKLVA